MKALDIQSAKELMVVKGYEVSEGNDTWTNVDYASWVAFCRYNVTNSDLPKSLYGLAIPDILEIERNLPEPEETPLAFTLALPEAYEAIAGEPITLSVTVEGGQAPYTYVWSLDGLVLEGETSNTLNLTQEADPVELDGKLVNCVVTDGAGSEIRTGTLIMFDGGSEGDGDGMEEDEEDPVLPVEGEGTAPGDEGEVIAPGGEE